MNDKVKIISNKFELDDIAESVREKTKLTGKMSLGQIAHNIRQMAGIGQGILTTDATIESGDQMLEGVTAYGASGIVTGIIPSQEATNIIPNDDEQIAIPAGTYAEGDVTVSPVPTETKSISSNGTYVPEDGKYFSSVNVNVKSAGESFETQSKTVTPTESRQTVFPDAEYDGLSNVVVEPIPREYITTTDATAAAEHIFLNETAYVKGEKITGTFTIDEEVTTQEEKIAAQDTIIADIVSALEGKASGGGVTPPTYNMCDTVINYNITASAAHIYFSYLSTDENGFVVRKTTSNFEGTGSITINSLEGTWIRIRATTQNYFDSCSLSITPVPFIGEQPYTVEYNGDVDSDGYVRSGLEFNIEYSTGAWE